MATETNEHLKEASGWRILGGILILTFLTMGVLLLVGTLFGRGSFTVGMIFILAAAAIAGCLMLKPM